MSKKVLWILGIIGVLMVIGIIGAVTPQSQTPAQPSSPTCQDSKATNFGGNLPCIYPSLPPTGPVTCISFQYTDWSHCASDGTQSRAEIKALPEGCTGGSPIESQNCTYQPLPPGTTATQIYQRMINQIKGAPNQTISATYIAGTDGSNTTDLTWQVKDDGLYLYAKSGSTTNPADPSTMVMVDSNFDMQPDWISNNGQPFVAISPSDQSYKENISLWAIFNAYFASYLLK